MLINDKKWKFNNYAWWKNTKFYTRKDNKNEVFIKQWDDYYCSSNDKFSKQRRYLREQSNRKLRRYNEDIGNWNNFKKLYDLNWKLF